jgi:hypothetical protein
MNFSPEYLALYIIRPLRYLFEHSAPQELRWTDDPKTSGIEIDSINNFHKIAVQKKPRILVSRGQYQVAPVGLSDNMAQAKGIWENRGHREAEFMFMIQGTAQVMIQARNEGTAERILNLTQHFLAWTGPALADTFGFKSTFVPMAVSPCTPMGEDGEVFSTTINLPWHKEEHWQVSAADQIKFKSYLLNLKP